MQVPKLEKIVINIGLGDVKENPKSLDNAIADLTAITGQKPVVTKARKSIAAFKLREGAKVGCKVTLRSGKMYDFAYKLFNVALPRVRDFRGVSKDSFDGNGNRFASVIRFLHPVIQWPECSLGLQHLSYHLIPAYQNTAGRILTCVANVDEHPIK